MFLRTNVLNNLMKQAYKSGLIVARSEDAKGNEWIYLAGRYWATSIMREFIPKKTMGDIITLIGEFPEKGERFRATKEGNQIEVEMPMMVREMGFGTRQLTVTDVILLGSGGTEQRLLQDETTGEIYVMNNVFTALIDNEMIEEDKGECRVTELLYHPVFGILWQNNVCKFKAHFRIDDKNEKLLKNLKGIDITPQVPEG